MVSNSLMEVHELELAAFSGGDGHASHELADAVAVEIGDVAHIEHDSLLSTRGEVSYGLRQDSVVPMQNPDPPFHQQNRDAIALFFSKEPHKNKFTDSLQSHRDIRPSGWYRRV